MSHNATGYNTIDYLMDLSPSYMQGATFLEFEPYTSTSPLINWDNSVTYSTTRDYALLYDTFEWEGHEGATYDIFSRSYFDPFIVKVYDAHGNTIATSDEEDYGVDIVWDFVAPYTGTYYVSASWDQGSYYKYVSLSIYEDVDTAKLPVVDATRPTISIATNRYSLEAGDTAIITFEFNEDVTNFTYGDVDVSGGSLTNFTGSGKTYTARFTPNEDSSEDGKISVSSGRFTDLAGNLNSDGQDSDNAVVMSVNTVAPDTTPPAISISSDADKVEMEETATITFELSEPSSDFSSSDVEVSSGRLSDFSGNGSLYTAIFVPEENRTTDAEISVASGAFSDDAGNENEDGQDSDNAVLISIDTIPPEPVIRVEFNMLDLIVDEGVIANEAVLLKGLSETITFEDDTLISHEVVYQGTMFEFGDIDASVMPVLRDGDFTAEFVSELAAFAPSAREINYQDAISLVGVSSIDSVILNVAGADGSFVL